MIKGAKVSDEVRQRMVEAQLNRTDVRHSNLYTDEQRAKMRAAAERRWANHNAAKASAPKAARKKSGPKPLPTEERIARAKARNACKTMLRRVLAATGTEKEATTYRSLGYTGTQLREHLEAQFTPAMRWSNRESFHIDHRVPVSLLLAVGVTDPSIINGLWNLQVLSPEDNRKKSNKFLHIPRRK